MRYGYARVSDMTGGTGESLESQKRRLIDAGCSEENVCCEAYTGTKMDRPIFTNLISRLTAGDTLVVCKLDRFARTAAEGAMLVKELLGRGVSVHVLNMGLVEDSPTGRLILNIMLSFAEYERDMIVERLAEGKAMARRRDAGYREGRPRKEIEINVKKGETIAAACDRMGISRSTYYRRKGAG